MIQMSALTTEYKYISRGGRNTHQARHAGESQRDIACPWESTTTNHNVRSPRHRHDEPPNQLL